MELSVVVPVHNEAENLAPLLGEIAQALDGVREYEVVYVDDGSLDDTGSRLLALRTEFPRLRVLRHRRACGQSTALLTGIRAARAPVIATLDGDGQNDPADIPRLWSALMELQTEQPLAMVAGYRKRRQDTGWRRFSSRVANTVRGGLLRDHTPDTGCGLKVFSRELFLRLPYFDHMHRFLPALAQRAGGKVVSVEVNHRPRLAGVSKYGTWQRLWVGIVDLVGVMWLQRRAHLPDIDESEGPLIN
ncbi:glycosyltransferase family 2 protein [Methylococcus sp. EFPC2]|uniref:glycosyltransferase family 2 protein n=1 Tax=Methylococcus sp. EFPC2 TaxID=2812648 RepID=UPI0019680559|nr:glycosyltransferase family 2 protein [Methylococcus sp. EFPC2]QSA98301.1 glycosyltransferase family 2 protein [Methylococcus sp. EFPC2]